MANTVVKEFERNSQELKKLLNIEEGSFFDTTQEVSGQLVSDNPLVAQGRHTWELLDIPEIEVIDKRKVRVKIFGMIDADIDLTEYGIETEVSSSILFGVHFNLETILDYRLLCKDLLNAKETGVIVFQAVDLGVESWDWSWDEEIQEVIDEQCDDDYRLNQYVNEHVLPTIADSDWNLNLERTRFEVQMPRITKASKDEFFAGISSKIPSFKRNSTMTSRKQGTFQITVNSVGYSENKKIENEPVAYLNTPYVSFDFEPPIDFLTDESGNKWKVLKSVIEVRQQDAVQLNEYPQKGDGSYPSEVTQEAIVKLNLALDDVDSGILRTSSIHKTIRSNGEAFVQKVQ